MLSIAQFRCSVSKAGNALNFGNFLLYRSHIYKKLVQLCLIRDVHKPQTDEQNIHSGTSDKKHFLNPKITVIGPGESISVLTLEEAVKLSKRRDLKLFKIKDGDSKTQRPLYQMMTASQYFEEEKKQLKTKHTSGFKGDKLLPLSSKIEDHDLQEKLKKINKWLQKNFEVRVVISGGNDMAKCESIYNVIAEYLKTDGRIVQKRSQGSDLKFQILPPKKEQQKNETS